MNGDSKSSKNYILATPCKNEGHNLSLLIDSVISQTIRPVVWTIVDDGSEDNTPEIVSKYAKTYPWIKYIRLEKSQRDIGIHLARVIQMGVEYSISQCASNSVKYTYLGNLDGDLILPNTFYENIMSEFDANSNLGVASGGTEHIIGNNIVRAKLSVNEPSGGHMLIRNTCYEMIGGIPLSYAVDSAIKVKARCKGWDTKRFENNIATEIRDLRSIEGYWKGFSKAGEDAYLLWLHPLHVYLKVIKYSLSKPYYGGVAYINGYLSAFFQRKERIQDPEIKNYFRKKIWSVLSEKSNSN